MLSDDVSKSFLKKPSALDTSADPADDPAEVKDFFGLELFGVAPSQLPSSSTASVLKTGGASLLPINQRKLKPMNINY